MPKYNSFEEMNADLQFEDKAGFTLAPKQREAIETCSLWQRLANFSEVGCGKTVMATGTSLIKGCDTTLVTVPPILIPQWVEWLRGFQMPVVRYKGTPTQRKAMTLAGQRWIVMSHAIFRDDFQRVYAELSGTPRLEIIVDEAQAVKNASSVLYKSVIKLGAGHDIQLLTGTPTNKPADGYAYCKIKTPEVYRSQGHFENVHIAERDFFGSPTKYQNLELLASNLALQTVRFTKEEVFGYDLQPIFDPKPYDLDPKHLKLYDQLVEEQLLLLPDGGKIDATTATKLYHASQQIVCNWSTFSGNDKDRSAIYDMVDEVIEETQCLDPAHSKLIIWTHYKMTSRSMLAYLNQRWADSTVAAYSEVNSDRSIERFMKDATCRILVAQPSSAGMGLNPAHLCSEVLFVEASTMPMQIRQAIGRVDRKGQRVRPTIRFASAVGTIQKYLYSRLSSNDDMVMQIENLRDSLRTALKGAR